MSAYAHWTEAEWSKLTLGSSTLPGAWEVEAEAARDIDIKAQKDRDGAVIKDKGYENARVTLVGQLATKAEWDELERALREIHPRRKGAARDPLTVVHPALNVLGITEVYVLAIEAPKLGANDVITVQIRCLEWIPIPKPVPPRVQIPIGQTGINALATVGRILTLENGQEKVDLGIPPPRDSALDFIETPTYVLGE